MALERHGHVEQSEHKAKSFVDETVGHVIDQLRRSLKTEVSGALVNALNMVFVHVLVPQACFCAMTVSGRI